MPIDTTRPVTVVGAGPVGCVLATLLARRGFDVTVFEKRPDMRRADIAGGRSINLVLTDRGLRALQRVGLRERVLELTVPVEGRMIHTGGDAQFQPYGKDDDCNFSVSRGMLNEFLLDVAEEAGATIHFDQQLVDVDFDAQRLRFAEGAATEEAGFELLFGTDGAPSAVRTAMVEHAGVDESVEFMEWGYKELVFPAGEDGGWALEENALHIWPHGDHFLMGLANLDGSFTGTLYLPRTGDVSFESVDDTESVRRFFEEYYADAIPYLGEFIDEFLDHPTGMLGTVRSSPWHLDGRVLLVGDAAHGIVPFFGQGLNCGFEDCVVLQDLLDELEDLEEVFETFFEMRKPNTDAIADMALENAEEMGEKVADAEFLKQKKIEALIERNLDDIYRSRYAMVMYTTIPYRVAYQIGEVQKEILAELAAGVDEPGEVDLEEARALIERRLAPEPQRTPRKTGRKPIGTAENAKDAKENQEK